MLKRFFLFAGMLIIFISKLSAQGCSDAGFCTIGNYNANQPTSQKQPHKNEIDILYTYGTHGKNERFYQPQINYRSIRKSGSFFEIRVPVNTAKNKRTGLTNTGIGDLMVSYNSKITINTTSKIDYSIGVRASLTDASKGTIESMTSYPMYLQSGLGTTDLILVGNYNFAKYLSVGTGVQVPVIQYNKNVVFLDTLREGYRRKPDALLKLTGHYEVGRFKISGGLLGIFHLGDDYYKGNFKAILQGSKGTTINLNVDMGYAAGKNFTVSLLVAQPLKTRANIPDGLARSLIISPKVTFAF